jgi:type IV secretory pathway TraG/TraD family ATPase VirD4
MGLLDFVRGSGKVPASSWDEQTKLIHWKGKDGAADYTIGDSFEGVQVFGDTGSGKSSASAKLLASSLLRAGYGGLVLTVKPEDAKEWKQLLAENGREQDGVFFSPGSGYCFNFLDYELKRGQQLGLGSLNAAQILGELVSLAQRSAGRADDFWNQAANEMVAHTLEIIRASGETPSLKLAKEIIESAPRSLADVDDPQWQGRSKFWAMLQRGQTVASVHPDFKLAQDYWLMQFSQMADKTRSSVMATFTASVAQYFCPEIIHRLFGGKTNATPDAISDGKIIVVNLPVKHFGAAGRFAGIVWKYCAQLAIERRENKDRPVFIFVDESHHFLTDYDQLFQTTARSSRCAVVYLTQSLSNYYALSPGNSGKQRVDSMCNCLKTKILHQCSHPETRQTFAEAIGKRRDEKTSSTVSHGKGEAGFSETKTPGYDFWIHPDRATRLKTGGKVNDCKVEGIIYKAGKQIGDKPYLLVADFNQQNLEMASGHSAVAMSPPRP